MTDFNKVVIQRLTRIETKQDKMTDKISDLGKDLAVHKVKTGIFGTIGGLISGSSVLVWQWLKGGN